MTRSPVPLVGAVLLLCLAGPALRAEPAWTFTWTSPDTTIFADSGGSALSLFPSSGHGSGNSDIVAANLQAISSAPADTPDPFTGKGYTLNLHLVDDASSNAGDLTFTGHFDGSLSSQSVNLTHTFDQNTGTLNLGGHQYKVTLGSFNPPGLPGSTLLGTLGGGVRVDGDIVGAPPPTTSPPPPPTLPPVAKAPEPTALMLALLGLSSLGLRGFCRARRHRSRPASSV
ncbi:MAG: hypothetical protein HYS12_19040 [Planctomycetes bacterium]|nr:hypothetical protein [Planctomycetota bacterium]